MEVAVVSSDAAVWTEVPVRTETDSAAEFGALSECVPTAVGGLGFRTAVSQAPGSAPYIVWRIHEDHPNTLELMELSCDKAVRSTGLRLSFEFPLCPFATVTLLQMGNSQWFSYEAMVITTSGVLCTVSFRIARSSRSGFGMLYQSSSELSLAAELAGLRKVTAFAATPELLCIGGQNGSILCVPISSKAGSHQDQPFELKDVESGLSRLWGFSFRGKNAAAVRSLTTKLVSGASVLIAFHEDGALKVWDLLQRNRQFHQVISPPPELASSTPKMMWAEDADVVGHDLKLGLWYAGPSETDKVEAAAVLVCTLHSTKGDGGVRPSHVSLVRTVPVQGAVLSCKLLRGKVWVLQKVANGEVELLSASMEEDSSVQGCRLQESLVGEQLFQGSRDPCDNLLFALDQLGLSSSDMMDDSVPSLFLRRLLQPGVRQHTALKDVLQMRRRHLSDFEISSLTLDGLRKEIKSSIKAQPLNARRSLHEWISFSDSYVQSWKRSNTAYGLFTDGSTGSVGLIRRNSVSVVRSLTNLEQLVCNGITSTVEEFSLPLPQDWDEVPGDSLVITALLRCTENITRRLGHVALGVFHEALLRPSSYPLQTLVQTFLGILDVGYNPLDSSLGSLDFGVDEIRGKMQAQHQQQRKFALHMSQSLHILRGLAGSWEAVLDVVSKYAQYLVFSTQSVTPAASSMVVPLGSVPTKIFTQATSQISWIHFEAARDLLLLLSHLVKVQGQVGLTPSEATRIQLQILPQVQEGLAVSLLLHWLTVTFAEVPPSEDCSLQLSSLQIDVSRGEKVQSERLGAGELALAEILAASFLETTQTQETFQQDCLPNPDTLHNHVQCFVGWLLVGESSDPSPLTFSRRAITLSSILLQHGQYGSLECFLTAVEHFSTPQQLSEGIASVNCEWSARFHLLGICCLARAHSVLEMTSKEKHVGDAIQYFFRAASGLGEANKVLQSLFFVTGPQHQLPGHGATAAWRLQYFEWVMQLFDQYNLSEGACQFAHAALEQVDEAVGISVIENSEKDSKVVGAAIKGRLWANVFKFSLDLELYGNAYCAIISNPDEESKDICLRRFIIVLCDQRASQALCSTELPYGGLLSRVEEELLIKAQNSDMSVKASLYKLLYSLHIHHHNVGRAAGYMYQYALSIREQGFSKSRSQALSLLQEELDALAAAINALQLVEPSNGIVSCGIEWLSPSKRRRVSADNLSKSKIVDGRAAPYTEKKSLDSEQLVKEHAFTLARLHLLFAEVKHSSLGPHMQPSEVVLLLLQNGLYDMAFSLVFLFWKESSQKRELEKVFEVMARKCCMLQQQLGSGRPIKFSEDFQLALTLASDSANDNAEQSQELSTEIRPQPKLPMSAAAKTAWQALKSSLEKYWKLHPNLRATVAQTILSVDRDMELPLWLIDTFKVGKDSRGMNASSWVADPAALLRIYLDHERYVEATYLLLEYLQASTRLRPGDVIKRKQPCGVWFPYTLVDRLLRQLSEIRSPNHAAVQCEKLRVSLQNAVLHHFDRIKNDSDDVRVLSEGDNNGSWKEFSS